MNLLKLWLPMILAAAVIILASQFGSVPETPAWLENYIELGKIGHLALYFLLGFFVARYLFIGVGIGAIGTLVLTAAICVAFGVSDEVHQMFVAGRKAEFEDLAPDLVGTLAGSLTYLWGALVARVMKYRDGAIEVYAGMLAGLIAMMMCAGGLAAVVVAVYVGALDTVTGPAARQALERYIAASGGARSGNAGGLTAQASAATPTPAIVQEALARFASGGDASAGGLNDELIRGVLRDLVNEMKKELTKEVRNELVNEITQARDTAAVNPAVDPSPPAARADRAAQPNPEWNAAAKSANNNSSANSGVREKILAALRNQRGPSEPAHAIGQIDRQPERCDLVAVLVHPSNPVSELTLDQARRLFSGEYVNWSQVGGPNMPVKVITVSKRNGDVEGTIRNHLQAPLSPDAARVPLVSFIIPSVAQTRGAVGFLPVANVEQLDFVAGHSAFKRIAIKSDAETPARLPNRMALNTRTYPIMGEEPFSEAP